MGRNPVTEKTVRIALIVPSHYDDDGYVIQWRRALMPSNTLAAVHALAMDCAERKVLGPDVGIEVRGYDESNTVLPIGRIARWVKAGAPGSFVGLVGVQSNQFPRAMDIAAPFREAGIAVVVGGFHVSGCIAKLPSLPPDLQAAKDNGIILYAGECEGRLEELLQDLCAHDPKPVYNNMHDLPGLAGQPVPMLPRSYVRRTVGMFTSFDAGRGCPFQCSFCTIITVQGRKSRFRTADDIERIIRLNWAQGIKAFFITDDNFARNKNWEAIFDRVIELRRDEGMDVYLTMQVDTLCHRIPNFVEKAHEAGVRRIFLGLENINPENLADAKKKQNRIWEYRDMTQAWKRFGIITQAGYILGFPNDTPEGVERDLNILADELAIDLVNFYILSPLPGSEDHLHMHLKGVPMDSDMNNYDLEHVVVDHPKLSREEWTAIYWRAWDIFYSSHHMERVMRRRAACGQDVREVMVALMRFKGFPSIEGVHSAQGGQTRRKIRHQRRSGLPLESPWVFYPRRLWEIARTRYLWARLYRELNAVARKIERDPNKLAYTDTSLTLTNGSEEEEALEMMKVYGDQVAARRANGATKAA
jgi:radical SAM superfamily enzyme YgiQ (UPF0313 family)